MDEQIKEKDGVAKFQITIISFLIYNNKVT
jgi:hypothetical protein